VVLKAAKGAKRQKPSARGTAKSDTDVWAFVDAARAKTKKLGLTGRQVKRLVDRSVQSIRGKHG
jgi:hypothetical protein